MCFVLGSSWLTFADNYLKLQEVLQSYFNVVLENQVLPESYKYITIHYRDISNTSFKDALQKVIYLDMFPNASTVLPLSSWVTQKQVSDIIQSKLPIKIAYQEHTYVSPQRLWPVLLQVKELVAEKRNTSFIKINQSLDYGVLENMYQILDTEYIDNSKITGTTLLYWAAKWLAESLNDEYTTFMPPVQATSFSDEIQGEFEWIGAYIDIKKPWMIIILAPIDGSPADRAGLLAGDQILQVDDHKVTNDTALDMVVARVKWLRGTSVTIRVLRNNKELTITVKRENIVIKNIASEVYSWGICYINIRMFDLGVHQDFDLAMESFAALPTCTKYIFDVRNNPGWWLDEVVSMLDYIVPTQSTSVTIKGKSYNQKFLAKGRSGTKITDKNIIVLINQWSASASEIFAGVAKDYGSHVQLIGEKTFWKWSVQTMIEYPDGSIFKYTIAKRYTGKTEKNIDKIGFFPDKQIYDNPKTFADEQLDYALWYVFK